MGPKPKKRAGKKEQHKKAAELFEIRDTDGAGKGIFAKKDLDEGIPIFKEQPTMTVEGVDYEAMEKSVEAFKAMSEANQKAMLELVAVEDHLTKHFHDELAGHYERVRDARNALDEHTARVGGPDYLPNTEQERLKTMKREFCEHARAARVMTTFQTNCVPTIPTYVSFSQPRTEPTKPHARMFLMTARLNHSCVPNVLVAWNEKLQPPQLTWHTLRKIQKDEQLTRSYLMPEDAFAKSSAARQPLLSRWGFRCSCEACEGPHVKWHDEMRDEFNFLVSRTLHAEANVLDRRGTVTKGAKAELIEQWLRLVHMLLAVYKKVAGVDVKYTSILYQTVRVLTKTGRQEQAYTYAQKLVNSTLKALGAESEAYDLYANTLHALGVLIEEKNKTTKNGGPSSPTKPGSSKSG